MASIWSCNERKDKTSNKENDMKYVINAPEINTSFGWLNSDTNYLLKDFRGKIVLLDFWTFGCINCQHILPDLRKLEKEFEKELVVIGVHSAKFEAERSNSKILKAILKFGIQHPVVNDAAFDIWKQYAIKAWPTVVLITPDGKIAAQKSGEGFYKSIRESIIKVKEVYAGKINHAPFKYYNKPSSSSVLKFPSKLLVTEQGNIFISNSGHNQILLIDQNGQILEKIGNGTGILKDGDFNSSAFHEPHGLAIYKNVLYVADTRNNAIRKIDLNTKQVSTIAGDGTKGKYYENQLINESINPNSPWDLNIDGNVMYVANAGNHQILKMDLPSKKLYRYAGDGHEALKNGKKFAASFNQPSGLASYQGQLFVADAEASAIRKISLNDGKVSTLIGTGLFNFGDVDGDLDKAQLQHCVGLAIADGQLLIADTYNGKIKILDFTSKKITTLVSGLDEPNGVSYAKGKVYFTDTNNHSIYVIDLKTNIKKEIIVKLQP